MPETAIGACTPPAELAVTVTKSSDEETVTGPGPLASEGFLSGVLTTSAYEGLSKIRSLDENDSVPVSLSHGTASGKRPTTAVLPTACALSMATPHATRDAKKRPLWIRDFPAKA